MTLANHHQWLNRNWFTVLEDRILFFDGDTVVSPDDVERFIGVTSNLCVSELTDDLRKYNSFVDDEHQIKEKTHWKEISADWKIPEEYQTLNIREYVFGQLEKELLETDTNYTEEEITERTARIDDELLAYNELNLYPVLRAIIYIINTLRSKEVVWGVGRGSCVSSYVLYLLGVHDVDSIFYGLDYKDFLRPQGE